MGDFRLTTDDALPPPNVALEMWLTPPVDPALRRSIPPEAVEGHWLAPDGQAIRRIDWPGQARADGSLRGSLLFVPGRGDFYEKYLEPLETWHRQGWQVTALDWRGQAGSGRFGPDPRIGDVPDFSVWIDDLAAFWSERPAEPRPRIVIGHSMGGHLVLRALAERRLAPDAAVLVAPMLGFASPFPLALLHLVARLMTRIGDPGRRAWKGSEKPGASLDQRMKLLTNDSRRYADEEYWREARPELDMGTGSWRWVERACASMALTARRSVLARVTTPLLVLAAKRDKLVSYPAIRRVSHRLPRVQMAAWGPTARHELLREEDTVRTQVMERILNFLDRFVPNPVAGDRAGEDTAVARQRRIAPAD